MTILKLMSPELQPVYNIEKTNEKVHLAGIVLAIFVNLAGRSYNHDN